jgi:hypothetical protein
VSNAIEKAIAILEAGRCDALKALDALSVNRLEAAVKELRALSRRHWNPVYNTDPVQRACAELPEGWNIEIGLERGAGWVDLRGPDGEKIDLENDVDCFDWSIHAAIDAAVATNQRGGD